MMSILGSALTLGQICLFQDFPRDPVVKKPPTNAGDMGSIPGLGRSHKVQRSDPIIKTAEPTLQSPRAATTEPACCNDRSPCTQSLCFATREATTRGSPCTTGEAYPFLHNWRKPSSSNEDPVQPRHKSNIFFFKKEMSLQLSWHTAKTYIFGVLYHLHHYLESSLPSSCQQTHRCSFLNLLQPLLPLMEGGLEFRICQCINVKAITSPTRCQPLSQDLLDRKFYTKCLLGILKEVAFPTTLQEAQ